MALHTAGSSFHQLRYIFTSAALLSMALALPASANELQKLAPPTMSRSGARVVAQANNTSGVIGIRPRYVMFAEHPYLYFVASGSIEGKAWSTSFSAERHGKMVALKMAMARREKATGVKYDMTPRQALNRMKHLLSAR